MNKNISKKFSILTLLIVLLLSGNGIIFSQFLLEKEEPGEVIEIIDVKDKKGKLPPYIAFNIRAEKVPLIKDTVKITWNMNPDYTDTYIVGRSGSIIDTKERALASKSINSVSSRGRGVLIDSGLAPGKYYYVVLARGKIANRDIELYRDVNYTTFPVEIKKLKQPGLPDQVSKISVRKVGKKGILITWKKPETGGVFYTVYRSHTIIDTVKKLQKAEIITVIQNRDNFIDEIVDRGRTYYYAVSVKDSNGRENKSLVLGQNYTASGLFFSEEKREIKRDSYRIKKITARRRNNRVILRWKFEGTTGARFFRVFRSKKIPRLLKDVKNESVIAEVDIEKKVFYDNQPLSGKYYYGLVPYQNNFNQNVRLEKGVFVTSIDFVSKTEGHKKDRRQFGDEELFSKKPGTGRVDKILKNTYLKGFFSLALKELQQFIRITDNNYEKAMARYFIGRTYIEQKKYAKSLKYLKAEDVKRYFPEESRFWSEYSILHLR